MEIQLDLVFPDIQEFGRKAKGAVWLLGQLQPVVWNLAV